MILICTHFHPRTKADARYIRRDTSRNTIVLPSSLVSPFPSALLASCTYSFYTLGIGSEGFRVVRTYQHRYRTRPNQESLSVFYNLTFGTSSISSPGLLTKLAKENDMRNRGNTPTSSYKLGFSTPSNFSPSQRIPAVIPLPQLVIIFRLPSNTSFVFCSPTDFINAALSSDEERKVVYVVPDGDVCVWRNALNGREKENGICPDESPCRGSESLPVNLVVTMKKRSK